MKQTRNRITGIGLAGLVLAFAPATATAWLAHGFGSGMSRMDVSRYLTDKELTVITESDRQTVAGPVGDPARYQLAYCSSPQRLYRMTFRLADSPAAFVKTLKKYEKRYGAPEGMQGAPDNWNDANWGDLRVSLIWHLGETETILLTHGRDGSSAEFQDLSICQ